jgi:hypothetical protein
MEPRELKIGEIVQIDPEHSDGRDYHWFGGCLMVVTESKPWGAQGYVQGLGPDQSGQAYYRCEFKHMEPTGGFAKWMSE